MPSKITGLHMDGDAVVAVQVRAGLKGLEVTTCARVPAQDGMGPEENLKALLESDAFQSDRFVTQLPDKEVFFRNLSMPFKDRKKIRQALPFEMETLVPMPVEELVTDFLARDSSDGTRVLTASATTRSVAGFLAGLQAFGRVPDLLEVRGTSLTSLVANQDAATDHGIVLDMGSLSVCMGLFANGQPVLIRILSFEEASLPNLFTAQEGAKPHPPHEEEVEAYFRSLCKAINETIHGYRHLSGKIYAPERVFFTGPGALLPRCQDLLSVLLEIPAAEIDLSGQNKVRVAEGMAGNWNPPLMNTALSLAMRGAGKGTGFNLLRDEFKTKRSLFGNKKEWRTAAIFLLIILFFLGADMTVEYYSLKTTYDTLNNEIVQVFKKTFPRVSRIVDPVQQMKVEIRSLRQQGVGQLRMESRKGPLDLLREISFGIPKSLDLIVTRMVIDPETVSIKGRTDTFNSVDRFKNGLSASPLFDSVNISSANLDRTGKTVTFEMKLIRK